jgi:hypothetical protein
MRTLVSKTSLRTYDDLRAVFNRSHTDILSVMTPGYTYSRREIASMLGMETSSMAARVHELLKLKQLEVNGVVTCTLSGREVKGVKLVEAVQ